MQLSPEQIERHNQLFSEASEVVKGEIILDERNLPSPGWFVRRRLTKAKKIFEEVIAINATNWSAMFMAGKIEQRLGNRREALDWMFRAREFAPDNTSLAKEASAMASQSGMHEMAARIADEAIALAPHDAALIVNAGLAHILNGQLDVASARFREAARLEPHVEINRKLEAFAAKVASGSLPPPKDESDIMRGLKSA